MRRVPKTALIIVLFALLAFAIVRRRAHVPHDWPHDVTRAPDPASTATDAQRGAPDDIQLDLPLVSAVKTPLPHVLIDPMIRIFKGVRTLVVYSDGAAVKTYVIALGASPEGDKECEGDGRTPEGEFYVCTKNPESGHRRALGISYPSEKHAERALDERRITKRQFRMIREASRRYERPPWGTPLGGEIMIHGGGASRDWTQGCIAVTDNDAEELYDAIPLGAPIEILP